MSAVSIENTPNLSNNVGNSDVSDKSLVAINYNIDQTSAEPVILYVPNTWRVSITIEEKIAIDDGENYTRSCFEKCKTKLIPIVENATNDNVIYIGLFNVHTTDSNKGKTIKGTFSFLTNCSLLAKAQTELKTNFPHSRIQTIILTKELSNGMICSNSTKHQCIPFVDEKYNLPSKYQFS